MRNKIRAPMTMRRVHNKSSAQFNIESKFDNPERLPNFAFIKYEVLVKDAERLFKTLSNEIIGLYIKVII